MSLVLWRQESYCCRVASGILHASACMCVLWVVTGMCVRTFALFLTVCSKHKKRVSVCVCRSSDHYEIIILWGRFRGASHQRLATGQGWEAMSHMSAELQHSNMTSKHRQAQTGIAFKIRKLVLHAFWTYPWHNTSIKTGQLCIVIRYFLLYHPVKRTMFCFSKALPTQKHS